MTFGRKALCLGLACLPAALPGRAAAAAPDGPPDGQPPAAVVPATLSVSGECPAAPSIWADVEAIVPADNLSRVTSATIEISDLGDSYRVHIVGESVERARVFRDLDRDCDHRARFVAVFVVLTLLPPDFVVEAKPDRPLLPPQAVRPTSTPRAPEPVTTTMTTPTPRRVRVDLSALFDWAPPFGSQPQIIAPGGELRVSWGSKRFVVVGGAGLEPHGTFRMEGLGVQELRVPLDLGVGLAGTWHHASLVGELGVAGAIFRVSGGDTDNSQSGTRVDLGARLGAALRLGSRSATVAPIVGVHALFFPKPYEVTAVPQGTLGPLPAFWVGATAGLSFAR